MDMNIVVKFIIIIYSIDFQSHTPTFIEHINSQTKNNC